MSNKLSKGNVHKLPKMRSTKRLQNTPCSCICDMNHIQSSSKRSGASKKMESETGASVKMESETGASVKMESETGERVKLESETGASVKMESETGASAKMETGERHFSSHAGV